MRKRKLIAPLFLVSAVFLLSGCSDSPSRSEAEKLIFDKLKNEVFYKTTFGIDTPKNKADGKNAVVFSDSDDVPGNDNELRPAFDCLIKNNLLVIVSENKSEAKIMSKGKIETLDKKEIEYAYTREGKKYLKEVNHTYAESGLFPAIASIENVNAAETTTPADANGKKTSSADFTAEFSLTPIGKCFYSDEKELLSKGGLKNDSVLKFDNRLDKNGAGKAILVKYSDGWKVDSVAFNE